MWSSELAVVVGGTGGVGRLIISRLLTAIDNDKSSSLVTATGSFIEDNHDTTASSVSSNDSSASHASTVVAVGDDDDCSSSDDDIHGLALPTDVKITGVRALVRNVERAAKVLPTEHAALTLHQISDDDNKDNTTTTSSSSPLALSLQHGLKGGHILIMCVGTTAYPTRAWRNGNTPRNVDDKFVDLLTRSVDSDVIKRIVLTSSIGTGRANKFPFVILNLFGVLDAKRRGEDHVKRCARENGCAYAIVRVGRLVGGPHTNVGMLKEERHADQGQDVVVEHGDCITGDLTRDAAADAVVAAALWRRSGDSGSSRSNSSSSSDDDESLGDLDFAVVHEEGSSTKPSRRKWARLLQQVAEVRAPDGR